MKPPILEDSWSEEIRVLYSHDMQEMWDPRIARHKYNMYQYQLNMYRRLVPDPARTVLDVGCAQGTLALLLAEDGYKVTAVDIRQDFLDYAKSRWTTGEIEFVQGNAFELQLETKFDVIFANQILEHVVYPQELIQKLSLLLNPGGKLIMTTPNSDYVRNSLPTFVELGDPKCWEHKQFFADGDDHFFAYTKEELLNVFSGAGMENVECRYYGSPWISGQIKFRLLHGIVPYGVLYALEMGMEYVPYSRKAFNQLLIECSV